jgi:hypothetical protein
MIYIYIYSVIYIYLTLCVFSVFNFLVYHILYIVFLKLNLYNFQKKIDVV